MIKFWYGALYKANLIFSLSKILSAHILGADLMITFYLGNSSEKITENPKCFTQIKIGFLFLLIFVLSQVIVFKLIFLNKLKHLALNSLDVTENHCILPYYYQV